MARPKEHGNGKLEEALQTLVQSQATLVQTQASFVAQNAELAKRHAEIDKEMAEFKREADARFARIESILLEHNRILSRLADSVGEKIGFKTQPAKPSEA